MLFGCNWSTYGEMSEQVDNITMVRTYGGNIEHVGGVPVSWPVLPANVRPFTSFGPDPDSLIAGELDDYIIAFLRSAPERGWLTTWHEANLGRIPPAQATEIHRRMLRLTHEYAPQIRYGSVSAMGKNLRDYVIWGLDFYAIDVYDSRLASPYTKLDNAFAQLPNTGRKAVAETNSRWRNRRPKWFWGVYHWLHNHGGSAMLTYWNPTGRLSGPWLPDDEPTIHALNDIALRAKE